MAKVEQIMDELRAGLKAGNVHAVKRATNSILAMGLDPDLQLHAEQPLIERTLQILMRRGKEYQDSVHGPSQHFRTVAHIIDTLTPRDWPGIAKILEDNKHEIIRDLLLRMREGWTASALIAAKDLQRWGRRWPELATIARTALDDVDRVDESRDDYTPSTENLLRYLRQDLDKGDHDAALEIIGELAWPTHPSMDLSELLNSHKRGLMRAMLTTMSSNDSEGVQYIMPQYLGGFAKFGVHWPEFDTIERSVAAMGHEQRDAVDEDYALGEPAPQEINDLFEFLENSDGFNAVASLYRLADADLDPTYAEDIAPYKDLIIRGMLQWANEEPEWAPTVLTAIDTLRDIGLDWPELAAVSKSALSDFDQLTETNPVYAKQDAERAVRGISSNLEKMRRVGLQWEAYYQLIDALYGVLAVNRSYADMTTPVLEHYKTDILRTLLWSIKTSVEQGRHDMFMNSMFDAFDRARVNWPEIDAIKRSMRARAEQSAGIAESTMNPHQLRYITQTLDNHTPWKAANAMIQQGLRYDSNPEIKALWDANKDRTIIHMLKLIKADPNHTGVPLMIKDFKTIGLPWSEIDSIARSISVGIAEAWSKKYKRSINCSHPKGFSQKAHCAARRKRRAGGKTKSKSVGEAINPISDRGAIAYSPIHKPREPRKVEPAKLGVQVDVRREHPRDPDEYVYKKPKPKKTFSLDDELDEAIRGQHRWIQRVADNLAWDFEHNRDLEIGYTIQKLNQTDPSEVQEIFEPLAQSYADWFQRMVDANSVDFGLRELDRLLGYIREAYPQIIAAVEHNKTAIMRYLLTLVREEHHDLVKSRIALLRDLGADWKELNMITRSLLENEDPDKQQRSKAEARQTILDMFARDMAKNGDRGIYYVMYHMDDWGFKLADWPELLPLIDAHKHRIVSELLKTHRGDYGRNREGVRLSLDRMRRIGLDWPELDVIRKSLDAGERLNEDGDFEEIMEFLAGQMSDMSAFLEEGNDLWLVGVLSEIYTMLENENLHQQYWPEPHDWDIDLEANKTNFVKGILEAIKLGEVDEAVPAVHMLKDYWHVNWPELDVILKSANAIRAQEIDELRGYRADPVYRAAKREFKPHKMKTHSERDTAMEKLTDYLETQGFKHIGQGSYSEIYLKPGYPWMFKLWSHDPAYLWWITWAAKHQDNPNVPRVKGLPVKIAPDTYVVRLEKLRGRSRYDHKQLADMLDGIETVDDISKEDLQWIRREYPGIYDALRVIQRAGSDFVVDLHSDNIMMRGQIPVLADPVVG